MGVCPHCKKTSGLKASDKNIGSWGYPVQVITCSGCNTLLGTTITNEMQSMIETIYKNTKK